MYRRALLIALFCAAAAVSLFVLYLKRFETESSGGERVRVLAVLKPLERGQKVTEDALTVREIPQAYVEDRAIRAADKTKILGLRVGGLVQAQQTLMWTDLTVASEEHRDLSALVQPGRRAVSIDFRADSSTAMIRPGDYVDVLGVLSQNGSEARAARVLLQRVLVLAVGSSLGNDLEEAKQARGGTSASSLTLSVTLSEAQLLALTSDRGALSVALRGPDDGHRAERIPDVTVNAMLAQSDPERAQPVRRAPTEISAIDAPIR